MMGQLIKTGGREVNFSLHRFAQHTGVGHAAIVVHIGIAGIKGNRVVTMLLLHSHQFVRDSIKGLLPANLHPFITLAHNRFAQTIRVGIDILHGCALGADIAAA